MNKNDTTQDSGEERMEKNGQNLRELGNTIMHSIIHVKAVPEGKERRNRKNIKQIIILNFLKFNGKH